jgi:GNAT superfamily N-acetyltransferase
VLERPLSGELPAPDLPPGYAIRPLTPADLDAYWALRPEASRQDVRARIDEGNTCFGAWAAGRLVATCWTSSVRSYIDPDIPVAPGEVVLFDAYTAPDQRGRSLAPALGLALLADCQSRGFRTAVRYTVPWNSRALRAHAKAGFRRRAVVRILKLGPRKRISYGPPVNDR